MSDPLESNLPDIAAANARHAVASADFTVTNRHNPIELASTRSPGLFCVYLRAPSDAHGNGLNSIAWLVDLTKP